MKKHLLLALTLGLIPVCYAQIQINNTGYTPTQLVTNVLVPTASGVSISNVSFKGVYNNSSRYQVGAFTTGSTPTTLGFSSGIILTSGNTSTIPISFALDPRDGQMATAYTSSTTGEVRDAAGDADAKALVGSVRNINSAILEFDFVPSNSQIAFNYVFGSEEYEDNSGLINYQCSNYNDKFGFLISGPGITGSGTYANNALNIARLGNGSEVGINSVNNGVVGSSGGSPSAAQCLTANPAWVQNTPTTDYNGPVSGIAFNGNTRVLRATQGGLTPGATYHIRLIVTDASDGTYDSAVFLEAASFSSPPALPVEIVSFQGKTKTEGAVLDWQTAVEQNVDYFGVEKSNDGTYFQEISRVKAKGAGTTYHFVDENDYQDSYYRLRFVDLDGVIEYSPSILLKEINPNAYKLFPNPTQGIVEIQGEMSDVHKIQLFNLWGKELKSIASSQNTISLEEFPAGVYHIKIQTSEGEFSYKVMKQ